MRVLSAEIEIDSTPEGIWRVLADFDRFPEWNPFIREISGDMREGARLKVRIEPPGAKGMTFTPVVKRVEVNREFRWLGNLILPGLFDGEHIFEIVPAGEGKTRFIQREEFRGLLVPLFWKSLEGATKQGFLDMNAALKRRLESFLEQVK